MKRLSLVLLSTTVLGFFTSCGGRDDATRTASIANSAVPKSPTSKGTIGVSVLTLTNPFFKVIADGITDEAKKNGYDVVVVSGEFDVARQQVGQKGSGKRGHSRMALS